MSASSVTARRGLQQSTDGRGLDTLPITVLEDVVEAVWWEGRAMRAGLHRLRPQESCELAVVAGTRRFGQTGRSAGPAGPILAVTGQCLCRDHLVDSLVEADRFLRAHPEVVSPPAAVRRHLRMRGAADWTRRRRTEMGAQARTDRLRRGARARALPDELHRALFEYVADEAGSAAPLQGDAQLHLRLARRLAAEFGGKPDDYQARVVVGLAVVEAQCRRPPLVPAGDGSSVRVSFWQRYVEEPLGRRSQLSPADLGDRSGLLADDDAQADALRTAFQSRVRHAGPEAAAAGAIAELAWPAAPPRVDPRVVLDWATDLVADLTSSK